MNRLCPLLPVILLAGLLSCDDQNPAPLVSGQYEGVFYRTAAGIKGEEATVSLTFSDGHFSGESALARYPAICSGSYQIFNNTIEFDNRCYWTADFDWTLILDNRFTAAYRGDKWILTKQLNDAVTDTYELVLLTPP